MTTNRVKVANYSGNQSHVGSGTPDMKYCFGHKAHRRSGGGKVLGKLKLFYCAECAAVRATKKEQPK